MLLSTSLLLVLLVQFTQFLSTFVPSKILPFNKRRFLWMTTLETTQCRLRPVPSEAKYSSLTRIIINRTCHSSSLALKQALASANGLPPSTSSTTVTVQEYLNPISPEPTKTHSVSQDASSSVLSMSNMSRSPGPVLPAWYGTNSQIKAAAAPRSTPVKPSTPAMVMATSTVKLTTTPSAKALDPSRKAECEPNLKAHTLPEHRSE